MKILHTLLLFVVTASSSSFAAISNPTAYFKLGFKGNTATFTIMLMDAVKIQYARKLLEGEGEGQIHVMGLIVKEKVSYNPEWNYHLDSASIRFFESAMEVCDAKPQHIEDNLVDVGDSFLPNNRWCPWKSHVVKEIFLEENH